MKILWLSNKVQSGADDNATGGWLAAMAAALVSTGNVELGNITHGRVSKVRRQDFGEIRQWLIPFASSTGSPASALSKVHIQEITRIAEEYSPDLIHVWGTEDYWGLLTARQFIPKPALLDMQGLKGAIAPVFHGGLTVREQLACIGLKEIIKGFTIFDERRNFEDWDAIDREIVGGHHYVAVQTAWMEAQVRAINSGCRIFWNDHLLRDAFFRASPWQFSGGLIVFCSAAYPSPFKGLHVAIRATAILRHYYPNIELHIAGALQRPGIRQEGYIAWLNHEVAKLNLVSNVKWLGGLSASQVVDQLKSAAVMILPSFIENCSNAMQEGMLLGVPMAVSYAGGLPSLAKDEDSALFFPPGDEVMCAYQTHRLLSDRFLSERISRRAREIALERGDRDKVVQNQIDIYRQVIAGSH